MAASRPAAAPTHASAITDSPILYHRTGGIAGTDDRVVIWADGKVEVDGQIMPSAMGRVPRDRVNQLILSMGDWNQLKDRYIASDVADAYLITIDYRGKSVQATDINPDLPKPFRDAYTRIEAIAAQVGNSPPAVNP